MFLLIGMIGLAAYFALPADTQEIAFEGFGLAAVAALLFGVRVNRPVRAGAWIAIALGIGLSVAGDIVYTIIERDGPVSVPSVADLLYLAAPMLMAFGFARLANGERAGLWRPAFLDSALLTVAIGVVAWGHLIDPAVAAMSEPTAVVVAAAYPLLDLLLVGVLARHLFGGRTRTPAVLLVVTGLACWLAADFGYMRTSLTGAYSPGTPLDAGWLIGYLLFAAAALHPSMRDLASAADPDGLSRRRIALVGAALLVPAVSLAVQPVDGPHDVVVGAAGASLIVALIVGRLMGSLVRTRALLSESDALRAELGVLAWTDALTGLPNRAALADRAARALRSDRLVGLLFLDLDGFKRVNDTWGHAAGDVLLTQAAARMRATLPEEAMLARLGGDEFAVLLPNIASIEAARQIAANMLAALSGEFVVGDLPVAISASAGVAVGRDMDWTLLARDADVAMYEAKRAGGSAVEIQRRSHERVVAGYRLGHELDRAVERDELRIWFQPIVDFATDAWVGAEALVRWKHPTRGLLDPPAFVPLAQSTGAMQRIDRWVVQRALEDVGRAKSLGRWPDGMRLHINLSLSRQPDTQLIDLLQSALAGADMRSHEIVIEVSETLDLASRPIARFLRTAHELGVSLALDDVGNRHVALAPLAALPFSILKIDPSVWAGEEIVGARLLEGIVRLASGMGMTSIAEGIETRRHLELIKDAGCGMGQGFALARPAPLEGTIAALRAASPAMTVKPGFAVS